MEWCLLGKKTGARENKVRGRVRKGGGGKARREGEEGGVREEKGGGEEKVEDQVILHIVVFTISSGI